MQRMIQRSVAEGHYTLGYGRDTNMYGYHLSTGLMQAKVDSGFKAEHEKGATVLMKITDYGIFDMPIFFYNHHSRDMLRPTESTLILKDGMMDQVSQYEGATLVLNVYVLRDGQLVKAYDGRSQGSGHGRKSREGGRGGTGGGEESSVTHGQLAERAGVAGHEQILMGYAVVSTAPHELAHWLAALGLRADT